MLSPAELAIIYNEYITRAVNTDPKKANGVKIEPMIPEEILEYNRRKQRVQELKKKNKIPITAEDARSAMEQRNTRWLEEQAQKLKDKEKDGPEL